MKLTLWTYEGPPHVGAMRVAASLRDVHYVLHAPQGDSYADLLFTMIERSDKRPPVTYTTFQARDLGADTAELFKAAVRDAYGRFKPRAMLVGASCTAELIQDDPGGLAAAVGVPCPVVPLELPAYSKKENWGAAETFYQVVRTLAGPRAPAPGATRAPRDPALRPVANILGPTALGFRCRDDVIEVRRLLAACGVDVGCVAPLGATVDEIAALGEADFSVVLYPEVAHQAAAWLHRIYGQPLVKTIPYGVEGTREFIEEVGRVADLDVSHALETERPGLSRSGASASRLPWYSRSVDSTYLTAKRVYVFGDATHAVAAARVARDELGLEVVGLGTYSREFARDVREACKQFGVEPLITDDYLDVERAVAAAAPELVLGTQMERHIAKKLGVPCAVISAPMHVQDVPARHSPQMGWEGANVLFDTWVHPLMMGLEEHLLQMFREDFEFGDQSPSHLGHGLRLVTDAPMDDDAAATTDVSDTARPTDVADPVPLSLGDPGLAGGAAAAAAPSAAEAPLMWTEDAERELKKIPFFVRGKARRNTERFAAEHRLSPITVEVLYEAKAHFGGGR